MVSLPRDKLTKVHEKTNVVTSVTHSFFFLFNYLKFFNMDLSFVPDKKNAFDLKEWKRCHSNWRVVDIFSHHVCGWQWVTITCRLGHGSTFQVFHFSNREKASWWLSSDRYFWK